MLGFLLRRLIWGLLVLLSVAVITFFLSRVVPADPAAFLAGQNASEATVQRIRAEHGLDRPLPAAIRLLHGWARARRPWRIRYARAAA